MKEFIKSKCYELLNTKDLFLSSKKEFLSCAEDINNDGEFWMSGILVKAHNMQIEYCKYNERKFALSQFVHVLGEEYIGIYEEIVGNE